MAIGQSWCSVPISLSSRAFHLYCRRFLKKKTLLPHYPSHFTSMDHPKGTIVFTTVGRPHYGFDVFSVSLPPNLDDPSNKWDSERRLTDGTSVNFNGQFVDEDQTLVYVSERSGSSRIYLSRTGIARAEQLPSAPGSLFHDRPILKNQRIYFIPAHEPAEEPFKSWSALYSTGLDGKNTVRLTPYGSVDYSPAISQTGKLLAVASYGSRPWAGDFHELKTDIIVFPESDPTKRVMVCEHAGWPTWSDFGVTGNSYAPRRVTSSGLHSLTPAAMHNGEQIAVATRRRDKDYRHIEIFDAESKKFYPVTELINPSFHHYNPFVSPGSGCLGYHRFRGESAAGESRIPHLDAVLSPIDGLRMLRLAGSFPSFSPAGDLIAFNPDFDSNSGVKIVKSDGSKRWTLLEGRTAFYNSWSPAENNVVYTSIGPIFQSVKATVQIARISFDLANLRDDREDIPVDVKILTREDTGNNAFPSCSPDGKFVVFRSGRSGHKNLYILWMGNLKAVSVS
ncbi:hypothetical protein RJ639_033618 [Escallonia herrerae]|uniref:Uncharacterized protein n=1 Tax=Escallonia herrerae TaxID=1293975 RepID=A0AA89BBR4_9ASTE|nr:hypothetical protein RJ639_033618 [Escallonia herrerae]